MQRSTKIRKNDDASAEKKNRQGRLVVIRNYVKMENQLLFAYAMCLTISRQSDSDRRSESISAVNVISFGSVGRKETIMHAA